MQQGRKQQESLACQVNSAALASSSSSCSLWCFSASSFWSFFCFFSAQVRPGRGWTCRQGVHACEPSSRVAHPACDAFWQDKLAGHPNTQKHVPGIARSFTIEW